MTTSKIKPSTWQVIEPKFKPENQHHLETILTQGNGYLSTRGSFEERFPSDRQATFIHGLWDDIPIVFTELVNAPDWSSLELWINGERFRLDQGLISQYRRVLNLKTGILSRSILWSSSETGPRFKLSFERFASLDDPHLLASLVSITPLTSTADIRVRAYINGHVENNGFIHWNIDHQYSSHDQAELVVVTRNTSKTLAISETIRLNNQNSHLSGSDCLGCPGIDIHSKVEPDELLIIQRYVGIATSRDTETPLAFATNKAKDAAKKGYKKVRAANNLAWEEFWDRCDMVIEGDDKAQLAIRHALFQLRIAAPAEDDKVSIGAKSLSGFGYRGHVFWDTEIFILPFFTLTLPDLSKNMFMYRWHTLPGARRKAAKNGYIGAQYSWESAETGDEVTPPWVPDSKDPLNLMRIWTGDIEIHITADIAYALMQFWKWTGDDEFWKDIGIPIILETALFWADRAESEGDTYSIRGVIGPDEYHEHVDNNAFTNYMAKWHLETALDSIEWFQKNNPAQANKIITGLEITDETLTRWKDVHENLKILLDPELGLFEQFEGFFQLKDIDLSRYQKRSKSMQEILGIDETNEHQVLKQPDVIMLLCLFRNQFDKKTWKANWEYYTSRTDHEFGSSLGPSFYAWAACEMNKPDLAYKHFLRAASCDLDNIRGNAGDGIHAASAGGLWQAMAFGFAGLDLSDTKPVVTPRLPGHWTRVEFKIMCRGEPYLIEIKPGNASITQLLGN